MTRICIFGAGAIGGYLGAALHEAGADVSLVARGPHLEAIRRDGLGLQKGRQGNPLQACRQATRPANLGPQDYVILAIKAHTIPMIIDDLAPLLGPDTAVVSAVNGLPWWYFHKAQTGTALDEKPLQSVDPGGRVWNEIGPQRAIGRVVYPACEIAEPGLVRHIDGERFTLGEPSMEQSDRVRTLSSLMIAGGLKAPQKPRIRDEIWVKLWGNCSFNPVSALTGATLDAIGNDPECRALVHAIMTEVREIESQWACRFSVPIEKAHRRRHRHCRPQAVNPSGYRGRTTAGNRSAGHRGSGTCRRTCHRDAGTGACHRPAEIAGRDTGALFRH